MLVNVNHGDGGVLHSGGMTSEERAADERSTKSLSQDMQGVNLQ